MRERVTDLVPRLRRYARALAGNAVSPDELVRSTLERAARQMQAPRADDDLRPWLFSLMHEAYLESPPLAEAAGLSLSDFDRALCALPPQQREVFLLVTLEEMSYQDVGRALNIPMSTVTSRLSRARESLRLQLIGEARLRMVR